MCGKAAVFFKHVDHLVFVLRLKEPLPLGVMDGKHRFRSQNFNSIADSACNKDQTNASLQH